MTLVFHLHASQSLYQSTDFTYQQLRDLEAIFPTSHFLKTQRALLLYHSKGISAHNLIKLLLIAFRSTGSRSDILFIIAR